MSSKVAQPELVLTEVQNDIIEDMEWEVDDLLSDIVLHGLYQDPEKPESTQEERAQAFFIGLQRYVDRAEEALARLYKITPENVN